MTTHAVAVEVKRRTCLVVAPPAADLSIVRRLLRDREVEPLMLADVPPIGVTVLDQLTRALARSEVVIFVLSTPNADANVYFEIGLARGQGKRLMILAPEGTTHVPGGVRELLVVKAQLDDDEAIGFSLDRLPLLRQQSQTRLRGDHLGIWPMHSSNAPSRSGSAS